MKTIYCKEEIGSYIIQQDFYGERSNYIKYAYNKLHYIALYLHAKYWEFCFKCQIFRKAIYLLFSLTFSPPLLAVQPCLLNTPRICMHSIVSIEYLKHFQNGKYLNRLDKQVTEGIVLGGYFA